MRFAPTAPTSPRSCGPVIRCCGPATPRPAQCRPPGAFVAAPVSRLPPSSTEAGRVARRPCHRLIPTSSKRLPASRDCRRSASSCWEGRPTGRPQSLTTPYHKAVSPHLVKRRQRLRPARQNRGASAGVPPAPDPRPTRGPPGAGAASRSPSNCPVLGGATGPAPFPSPTRPPSARSRRCCDARRSRSTSCRLTANPRRGLAASFQP